MSPKKPKTPMQLKKARRSAALKPRFEAWDEFHQAQISALVPADESGCARDVGGVVPQLELCLELVLERLRDQRLPASAILLMTVRTTDFPAARAQAAFLGRWLRAVEATPCVRYVVVEDLSPPGAVVHVDVDVFHAVQVAGPPRPDPAPEEAVPEALRAPLRAELDALVRGERPENLYWVHDYGEDGAVLVKQPEEIWDHPHTTWFPDVAGGWTVVLPLWTVMECPSELSAEIYLDPLKEVGSLIVRVM